MTPRKKEKFSTSSGKVLITAGPTIEPLDPVRFISNRSTGTMGYELALECLRRDFEVCLVTGPAQAEPPEGAEVIRVETAMEMLSSVKKKADDCDCLIMSAAVCDFRPEEVKEKKIKKSDFLELKLVKNPDILTELKGIKRLAKIGFALETDHVLESGVKKLGSKDLDLIVINSITKNNDPFGEGRNSYTLVDRKGEMREFRNQTKKQIAQVIVTEVEGLLRHK